MESNQEFRTKMSANQQQTGLTKSSDNHPIGQPPYSNHFVSYAADEIDLIDIGVLIWRRRRVVLVVFLSLIALTALAAVIKSPTYQYTTTVQIGSRLDSNGDVVQVISVPDAQGALQDTFIPMAVASYAKQHPERDALIRNLDINVKSGNDKGGTISLICKAKKSRGDDCVNIEERAASEFIKNTSRQINDVKANYQSQLTSAQLALDSAKSPALFKVNKLAAETAISQAKNELKDLQSKAAVLKVQKNKLKASEDLYKQEVSQLQQRVAQINQASVESARSTSSPTQAMANLVLSTQAQNNLQTLSDIQQKLAVDIPQQEAQINADIASNARAQALARRTIQQNESNLQKLLYQHNQNIQSAAASVKRAQSNLDNVQSTRTLGKALRSLKPIGVGRGIVIVMGVLVSLLLAFAAAFVAEFFYKVRLRLSESGN